jgi:hypothetical protein
MLWVRVAVLMVLVYGALVILVWAFQERLAFPAPRSTVPDPRDLGLAHGQRIQLATANGTKLAGWFLAPRNPGLSPGLTRGALTLGARAGTESGVGVPALLWFYGNGETIAHIWTILRDFQPPGTALMVVDYPGYGGSGGRATERALYEAADAAYAALAKWPGIDAARIYVYGRSLGTAVATYTAAHHAASGLILESPFTSAHDMSRRHYGLFPSFIVRLRLDNLAAITRIRCPLLVFHGTEDLLVPPDMGRRVAQAAPGPVELVPIEGAGHNETYERGGRAYRDKLWEFVR